MKNLLVILAILGVILLVILFLFIGQIKNTDFSGISSWLSNVTSDTNQDNDNLNIVEDDIIDIDYEDDEFDDFEESGEIEVVGDLNYYTVDMGRSDADILSKRTYTFYLPVDIQFELMGVDASSAVFEFKKDNEVIFKMETYDYIKPEEQIDKFWPTADDYSFVGDHTNILFLADDNYEDKMYIFADTLMIDDQSVF